MEKKESCDRKPEVLICVWSARVQGGRHSGKCCQTGGILTAIERPAAEEESKDEDKSPKDTCQVTLADNLIFRAI